MMYPKKTQKFLFFNPCHFTSYRCFKLLTHSVSKSIVLTCYRPYLLFFEVIFSLCTPAKKRNIRQCWWRMFVCVCACWRITQAWMCFLADTLDEHPLWLGSQRGLHRLPSENDRCRPQETEWGAPSLSSSQLHWQLCPSSNTRAQKTASGEAQFRTSLLKFDLKQKLHVTTLRL